MRRILALKMVLSALLFASAASAELFPDFLGKQLGEAEHRAKEAGFQVTVQKVDAAEKRGKILLQIPAGGVDVGSDRRIFLQVSDGIVVPDLTGKPLAEAQSVLKAIGLSSASSDRRHDGRLRGTVATQVPAPDERIDPPREIVFLDIVGGRYVPVPNVAEKLLSDALAVVQQGELKGTESPADPSFVANSVQEKRQGCRTIQIRRAVAKSTTPPAGTEIYPGQSVIVNYAIEISTREDQLRDEDCQPRVRERLRPPPT